MTLGIPRSLYFYYYGDLWVKFFNKLNIETIISPSTNKEIMDLGSRNSNDEMCLSLKNYIGHIFYLKDCDYILVPRIDNYGTCDQTCTNFLATYDIVNNLVDNKIINYNVDLNKKESEYKGLYKIARKMGFSKKEIKKVYKDSLKEINTKRKKDIKENINKLKSNKLKILLVGHPYNLYDDMIGKPIIDYLNNNNIEIIYSDLFDEKLANKASLKLSKDLYFKYNKENIGSIILTKNKIDGIIFISSFPCGPDSLVNELVIRKIDTPCLNIIIDDQSSDTGLITRLESFIDILEAKNE